MSERAWIQRYFAPLARAPGAAGLSDDTAELSRETASLVVTTDAMVEGAHFLAGDPIESVARKLVRVNVSDILSSGARPREALLTLGWPAARPEVDLARFAEAFGKELADWGIDLIGGDTVSNPGGLFLSLTLTGVCLGAAPVRRGGGAPGDTIWMTGAIGGARRGFLARADGQTSPHLAQLLEPVLPPLAIAGLIARHASAAMDISDGLLGDIAALAGASGCAATVSLDRVSFAGGAGSLEEALNLSTWGDDYQLVFCAPESAREVIEKEAILGAIGLARIGQLAAGAGLTLRYHDTPVNLPETLGFEHGRIGVFATRP